MKKVVKSAAILAAAVVCFTGCQKMQEEETVRTQVGIALYNEKDVFLRSIIKNVFELTRDSDEPFENLELEMQDAAADQILQNSQIKRFVDIKCQVLCANLVDRTSAGNIVSAAKDADIPVIFFERQPVEQDIECYEKAYYLGSNAEDSARLQAQIVLDVWKKDPSLLDANGDGELSYVILEGERGHQDAAIRTEYVVKALKEGGIKLKKVEGGSANFDRTQAKALMERWLNQDDFYAELVLANNDELALGAVEAIEKQEKAKADKKKKQQKNMKNIQVVGIDGTDEAKAAVDEGKMLGTVCSDQKLYARTLLQMIEAVSKGEKMENNITFADGNYVWIPWEIYVKQ